MVFSETTLNAWLYISNVDILNIREKKDIYKKMAIYLITISNMKKNTEQQNGCFEWFIIKEYNKYKSQVIFQFHSNWFKNIDKHLS